MAILIANIGTSDLAIKIDDYYIPVGFDRDEKNVNNTELDENEKVIWEKNWRQEYICAQLCHELEIPYKKNGEFSFRELTKKILEEYEKNEEVWHNQINPDRIRGVIEKARKEFNLEKVYIFVTNQPEKMIDLKSNQETDNRGYSTDSIHLFKIIQKWFKKEIPELDIVDQVIPSNVSAVDQDGLMNYYYKFFLKEITSSQEVLISIKGGTPQMQNALRMQALASSAMKQLFIEPKLSVKCLLAGKPSESQLTSYWRYMRTQKYQDVKNILESRWDFNGGCEILQDWKILLRFWKKHTDDNSLSQNDKLIANIIKVLKISDHCFNLDIKSANNIIDSSSGSQLPFDLINQIKFYDCLLNLYTKCRIYNKLDQSANLLTTMASFYEGVLERIAIKFDQRENFRAYNKKNRYEKFNFCSQIIKANNNQEKKQNAEEILNYLELLNVWIDKRNDLIHSATGISKERMREVYNERNRKDGNNRDALENQFCHPDKIVETMTEILKNSLGLIKSDYQCFVNNNQSYYIYSVSRDWAITKMITEGLE
ncbi:hypothetical protein PCC9214_05428 (plasmid) [Planktothrix tepida]|uniref:Uncharacterized protein n=1 Tax=Planktothrix tepida PCC 9214 TaxID=671072 RepID=A0A1J1LUD0_9CYAN|nr:hypothetical protein [Planktothrix tepida]CAD5988635.1 hypothetical protein PCC9214_05428 [Planktothrix tepida]CUR36208.1 conserved hypothetical protein [Planktothrix tepida PCC 9214]